MNKYAVIFNLPAASVENWVATVDEETRKQQAQEMMASWKSWVEANKSSIVDEGTALGKTKRVTTEGIADVRNDMNWFMMVTADSHEAAAELFKQHPHLQIPGVYIDVMNASFPGMN